MAVSKLNVAELVERMPATDKELEAQKAPPPGQPADPNKPRPRPERPGGGSKFTAPDPAVAAKACEELLAGGREALLELIGLIRDPASDDFKNYKPEYLCHLVVVHVGRPDRAAHRRMVIDTLVSQVGNDTLPRHTRGFLVRELEWIGDQTAAPALGRLLTDESFCDDAARTLLAIKDGAAAEFRAALPRAQGRCRFVVLQSLAALSDAVSADAFRKAVTDPDREIRLAAVWGLARLADVGSAPLLLKVADTREPWERIKATQACLLLAEKLAAAGKKNEAAAIYTHLRNTRTDPKERYVREAATRALEALSGKVA